MFISEKLVKYFIEIVRTNDRFIKIMIVGRNSPYILGVCFSARKDRTEEVRGKLESC